MERRVLHTNSMRRETPESGAEQDAANVWQQQPGSPCGLWDADGGPLNGQTVIEQRRVDKGGEIHDNRHQTFQTRNTSKK